MTSATIEVHLVEDDLLSALRSDVLTGLTSSPKVLPPKWFYDARGSELFDQITRLPEYYPTRTESALLHRSAPEIAALAKPDILVELGSGSAEKTRTLLTALDSLRMFVPQDFSPAALEEAATAVKSEYPHLVVHGVVSDFTDTLHNLPGGGRRMIAFLGGTIGNFVPAERAEFLSSIRAVLQPGEQLVLGAGLVIDESVLVPAYDDAAGVTAEFNRNVLRVINSRLGADFDPDAFRHVAVWDAENSWIEMRLEATKAMTVRIDDLELDISFAKGEQMRTEISAKFTTDALRSELESAGFETTHIWTDDLDRFALVLATAR
ncbi:MAG: L-histidine N(alpha)-methyltransferase [Nocardiaceae bacterium]|nr:L-histidine N(alpha)-methyltransferase [Nocardiaceae bacterium]